METAIFTGSFDPFTCGHHDIVLRSLPLFSRIVIGVGCNAQKQTRFSVEERVKAIKHIYEQEPRIVVEAYSDLTASFVQRMGAHFIIKGVRSVKDFEYEREQADINRHLCGVETLLLYASPQWASVSSSMVRDLMQHGADVSAFLPTPLCKTNPQNT